MLQLKGIEGLFTQSSAENERHHHASPYLFIRGGDRGRWGTDRTAAAAPREQTTAPTQRRRRRRRRDWGVRTPGIAVLVRNALRLVCTLSTRRHHRQLSKPRWPVLCPRSLSLRRTQPLSDSPSPHLPLRAFATLRRHDDGKDPRIGPTQPRRRARSNAGRPRL